MAKQPLNDIDGILLLNKPLHLTSNAALQQTKKRLFSAKKAGHTGSLDPLATGMLPLCFGEATKFSQFLLEADKTYEVQVQLGVKTTTGDAEGDILATKPVDNYSMQTILSVLDQFKGLIQQIPPMFSALKVQGKPLYELARKGIEIERQPRAVHIHQLSLLDYQPGVMTLEVSCSKGTYIRTLAEDIGEKLGCGAHITKLHRSSVNPYTHYPMYTLEDLETRFEQQGLAGLVACLLPIESSVGELPEVTLTTSSWFYLRTGQPVMVPQSPKQGMVRLYSPTKQFLGIGEIMEDGRVAPKRLISHPDKVTDIKK